MVLGCGVTANTPVWDAAQVQRHGRYAGPGCVRAEFFFFYPGREWGATVPNKFSFSGFKLPALRCE